MRCWVSVQHIVFTIKFLISAFIPDVPGDIRLAIKRVRISLIVCVYYFVCAYNTVSSLITAVSCFIGFV